VKTIQRLLSSTTTTGTALAAIAIDQWDTDSLYWENEVLREELERLAGASVPAINIDKLNALTTALTTDSFYNDFYVLTYICNALGGLDEKVVFSVLDPPTPKELAWTVFELNLHEPSEHPQQQFHPDVLAFMGLLLQQSAISAPPRALSFVDIPTEDVTDIFADDPPLYVAYNQLATENKEQIDAYVKARANQLLSELRNIPFENGDVKSLFEALHVS
jgi:hypothetical protein